jgi:hypothetical protein
MGTWNDENKIKMNEVGVFYFDYFCERQSVSLHNIVQINMTFIF